MNLINSNNTPIYANNHVQIKDLCTLPKHTVEKLASAADTIDNYAKHHKAKITFYDAKHDMSEFDNPVIDKKLSTSVGIKVQKKNEDFARISYINRYANEIEEKPFLRTVYEVIQGLVEGKESRIIEHKSKTMAELIKAGKIVI